MLFSDFFLKIFNNVFFNFKFDKIDYKIFKSINKNEYVVIKIIMFNDKNVNILKNSYN